MVYGMKMSSGGYVDKPAFRMLEFEQCDSWNRQTYSCQLVMHGSLLVWFLFRGGYQKFESLPKICLVLLRGCLLAPSSKRGPATLHRRHVDVFDRA